MTAPAHTIARADPLVLTAPARSAQRAGVVVLDSAVLIAVLAVGVSLLVSGMTAPGWLVLAAVLVLCAASILSLARNGRTLGHLVIGTRTVDRASGAPTGAHLLASALSGRLRMSDIRRGRDPLAPALSPFDFPVPTLEVAGLAAPGAHRPAQVAFDSGQRVALEATLIVGRRPVAASDASSPVFEWADLSRTLSKSHLRLEWDGTMLWATDLDSTNGTALRTPHGDEPLIPLQRTPLPPQSMLLAGDRTLSVTVPA